MAIDVKLTMDSIKIDVSLLSKEQFVPFAQTQLVITRSIQGDNWMQGKSWNGQPIAKQDEYSDQYKDYRARTGRKTSPVSLTYSYDLKNSAQVRPTPDGGELYFSSDPHPPQTPKPKTARRKKGGRKAPKPVTNAELAQHLVRRGYDLPYSKFGEEDHVRILKNYDLEVKKIIESLITVDKKA